MQIFGGDISMNGSGIVKLSLDSDYSITNMDYLSFTDKEYQSERSKGKIIYFEGADNFPNYIERNQWFYDRIIPFVSECEYGAIENYAFAAKGLVFNISEFTGVLKYLVYNTGIKIRLYEPTVIKKFASSYGGGGKEIVVDAYDVLPPDKKIELDYLIPPFSPKTKTDNRYESPRSDIIDAYWISQLLLIELKLRAELIQLNDLNKKQKEIFTKVPKKKSRKKGSILETNFIDKV